MSTSREKGAGFFLLIDPDQIDKDEMQRRAQLAEKGGADAILVGSSFSIAA